MVKSGLEIILKFTEPLQRYLLTCQANSALLGRFFCTGQQQLWRGSVYLEINSRPLFTIIFKLENVNFKTRDFSPLIEWVLGGVIPNQNVKLKKLLMYIFFKPSVLWSARARGGSSLDAVAAASMNVHKYCARVVSFKHSRPTSRLPPRARCRIRRPRVEVLWSRVRSSVRPQWCWPQQPQKYFVTQCVVCCYSPCHIFSAVKKKLPKQDIFGFTHIHIEIDLYISCYGPIGVVWFKRQVALLLITKSAAQIQM